MPASRTSPHRRTAPARSCVGIRGPAGSRAPPTGLGSCPRLRARLTRAARQHHREATRRLTEAQRLIERSALVSHLHARILEAMIKTSESPDRRRVIVAEAESLVARPKEICRPCSIGLRVAAAMACARAGELARSRHWLEHAERLAGMWSGGPWQAAVWEARGALRMAEGDPTQGLALLREAADLFGRFGRPLDEARCRSAMAAS